MALLSGERLHSLRAYSLLAVAVLLLAAAPPAPAAKKKRARCSGGITLERNRSFRIYETDSEGNRTVYACHRRSKRRYTIDSYFSCDCSVGDENVTTDLRGRYLVASHSSGGPPGTNSTSSYSLHDLLRRRELGSLAGDPVDLVVKRGGAFAYIAGGAVHKVERGASTVLDPGPAEAGSLALVDSRLYWMKGGQPFTATLR